MILDAKVAEDLKRIYTQLKDKGEILTRTKLVEYYEVFRQRFGPEVLKKLDGELLLSTMHEHGSKDSLVYWLEFKDDEEFPADFGSIAGGSALKFGIYKRKDTGEWMTGSPQAQITISIEEAISRAREHRDHLIIGAELLSKLPNNASDNEYRKLQQDIDKFAPSIGDTAWGHKYLSLLYPDKLDDYHNPDYQRYHLIKLLQIPPVGEGRYLAAGRYVAIATEMEMPINHLTSIANRRDGDPHRYWRVGTSDGSKPRNRWNEMKEGNCIAIGWSKLGDLTEISRNEESKKKLHNLVQQFYPNSPQTVSHTTNEIFDFTAVMSDDDIILAADGNTIIGIGMIIGKYQYDATKQFSHTHPVKWLSFEEWTLPMREGLRTTINNIHKNVSNLIETEKRIIYAPPIERPKPMMLNPLEASVARVQSILERKGQVIIYGPPGTGKSYLAEKAAKELAARSRFNKSYELLESTQQETISGSINNSGENVRVCCFHPAYGYEDFLEGYRPDSSGDKIVFKLQDGIFKKICADATANPQYNYYLIIDEINRGDIPRIFGELLMVLEKDKRCKPITLLLSGRAFAVPQNLYVIGTMNTADRSIALLDTALRRRFGFIELMPDVSVLGDVSIDGIPIGPWLRELNRRICEQIGTDSRNRQIGHSYLMEGSKPIADFRSFAKAVQDEIIPLLQEYCYEDYSTLEKILGAGMVNLETQQIKNELFDESNQTQLIQALLAPSPEISTSPQATMAAEVIESEVDEEEATEEKK